MATKTQYETLKAVYDDERARYVDLRNTGKVYLTICSFFLGGLAFTLNDVFSQAPQPMKIVFLFAVGAFVLAFLLVLRGLGIYTYEGLCDPEEVVKRFGDTPPSDSDFLDDRIVDIAAACSINVKADNRRAAFLEWASWAMFAGIIFGFASLLMLSRNP
jgi:hypothetical protein